MSQCDCALRSFWDGPCPEHLAEYLETKHSPAKFTDYGAACQVEINKAIDQAVHEAARELGMRAGNLISDSDLDKEFHILPMPPLPAEAWQFIEEAQKAVEEISGVQEKHPKHGNTNPQQS